MSLTSLQRLFSVGGCLSVGALLCAAPLAAQVYTPPTSEDFHSSTTTYFGPGILEDVEQVGQCEVQAQPKKSAILVLSRPGSPQEEAAYKTLFGNNVSCLGLLKELRVQRAVLRGVLAEALDKTPANRQPFGPGTINLPNFPASMIDSVADCYARANPDKVRALLATKIATSAEQKAFADIAPGFGPCIPAGARMTLDPDRVRLDLAEAAYRAMVLVPIAAAPISAK